MAPPPLEDGRSERGGVITIKRARIDILKDRVEPSNLQAHVLQERASALW
eukprot:CAMPEP_0118966992 /NCGR_PEP_ID=MMETSP1173-20130426/4421_1 /TAXON_ID=1034831 /ORGANISM="Rhizochromulina marina cf, Strain CCMP1243" /LENGTH=49 /DNA_ID=CAMNT_0006915879 /DNA_START=284 /DNA_END=433 /DNA_ORIENTATION=+